MSGARAALPMWVRFMKGVEPAGAGDFAGPAGVILVRIDPRTGGLTSASCPDGINEVFIEGTEPRQTCDGIEAQVQFAAPQAAPGRSGKRSTEF